MKTILIVLLILSIIAFGIFEVNKMANEYVRPTGHNDPSGSWQNEYKAYDGIVYVQGSNTNYAVTIVPAKSWSNYIELTISAVYCTKVKFYSNYNGTYGINSIDLDVYYNGAWHNVYEGSYLAWVWTEKSLGSTQYVSKMRMRFFNNSGVSSAATVSEAMFYETVGVPKMTTNAATGVSGGRRYRCIRWRSYSKR
jgi:hypothetical protein